MPPADPETSARPAADLSRWFADEVQPHDASLKAYLRGAFPAVRDVEDVAQESYLRLWRARAEQSVRSARGFLFQIARHVALDQLRRNRTSPVEAVADLDALPVADGRPDAACAACTAEEIALLADAIDGLPARCREIFLLRKLQRMPQRDIARLLGLSERTVQEQVARGMKRCEAFFADRGL